MHKTHIFDRPTYPIFLWTVTGNKQLIFLGLSVFWRSLVTMCTISWLVFSYHYSVCAWDEHSVLHTLTWLVSSGHTLFVDVMFLHLHRVVHWCISCTNSKCHKHNMLWTYIESNKFNPLMLAATKRSLTIWWDFQVKSMDGKIFENLMLIRTLSTTAF